MSEYREDIINMEVFSAELKKMAINTVNDMARLHELHGELDSNTAKSAVTDAIGELNQIKETLLQQSQTFQYVADCLREADDASRAHKEAEGLRRWHEGRVL